MSTASLTTLLSVLNVHGVASLISYARRSVTERQLSHWLRLTQPQSSGCWIVPRRTDRQSIGDRKAHRVFYEHFIGPIPGGLVLDHLCSNPICLNPTRVEPVTQHVNVIRAYRERRVVCQNGHPLSEV